MPDSSWSAPTRRHLPIILIRGFGGLTVEDEKALAYQGFNDGSVYPQKRGENYIYEGLILRLLKHRRQYYDATNVVGYFALTRSGVSAIKLAPAPCRAQAAERDGSAGRLIARAEEQPRHPAPCWSERFRDQFHRGPGGRPCGCLSRGDPVASG
jgi:hypothetical protein